MITINGMTITYLLLVEPGGHIRIDGDRPGYGQFELRQSRCHQPCMHLLYHRTEVAFGLVQEVLLLLRVFFFSVRDH